MRIRDIENGLIEIDPCGIPAFRVLQGMARLSYETAPCPFDHFIVPFEIEPELCDLSAYVKENRLQMDYVNGRLCSTYAHIEGEKVIFDAKRFAPDRGSPKAFLLLLIERLGGKGQEDAP